MSAVSTAMNLPNHICSCLCACACRTPLCHTVGTCHPTPLGGHMPSSWVTATSRQMSAHPSGQWLVRFQPGGGRGTITDLTICNPPGFSALSCDLSCTVPAGLHDCLPYHSTQHQASGLCARQKSDLVSINDMLGCPHIKVATRSALTGAQGSALSEM